jgi:hypothetical protein
MDKFLTQKTCDRCHKSLEGGRIMSKFNMDCICMACSDAESLDKDYRKAVDADIAQIRQGNYNYKGLRG